MMRLILAAVSVYVVLGYMSEHKIVNPDRYVPNSYEGPVPLDYVDTEEIPTNWDWGNIDGKSYLTKNLNQHLPQCNYYRFFRVCFYSDVSW